MGLHGTLVDVAGVGVLLLGPSGIGKSECALELLRRGHRLVADDVVELSRDGEKSDALVMGEIVALEPDPQDSAAGSEPGPQQGEHHQGAADHDGEEAQAPGHEPA